MSKRYPNSYNGRLWNVSSLKDCIGYIKGKAEWAIVDSDGGICIATSIKKEWAEEIANRLNGEKQSKRFVKYPPSLSKYLTDKGWDIGDAQTIEGNYNDIKGYCICHLDPKKIKKDIENWEEICNLWSEL